MALTGLLAGCLWAQTALMPAREAMGTLERSLQLMQSTMVAIPELSRAGAPVLENAKQALETLRLAPGQQSGPHTYRFLTNLRAYLALSDAVPKPFPFPDEARRQLSELRDTAARIDAHLVALLEQREAQLRSPDRDNLRRYAEANTTLPAPHPNRPRVVFLGDSITDGWRLNEYFPDRDVVNRGISGQITGEMLGRMQADVIHLRPEAVLILAGTNDIARGVPLTTIQNNLTMMADLADKHRIKPIFASVLPVSDYHRAKNPAFAHIARRPPATIRQLNDWLQAFTKQRGYLYVDYFSAMVDGAGLLKADLADDGLHPNAAGYRVMAPLALEAMERTVKPPVPEAKPRKRRFPIP